MIYLDTSVVLAHLLAEDHTPPRTLWDEPLVSSRLLEYEVWTRLHSMDLADSHGELARSIMSRISFLELARPVLARAVEPFPMPVRTLDALHLASLDFLSKNGQDVTLASFDTRQLKVARKMGIATTDLH